jgi:hypothetical protein
MSHDVPSSRSTANPLLRAVLLDPSEANFERRGFRLGDPLVRARLTRVGRTFIEGYNTAWTTTAAGLREALAAHDPALRGFAAEGAGMALMLGDVLFRWRRPRWNAFALGDGSPHLYLALVGAGWAFARTGALRPHFSALDPLLRSLVYDGLGFHEAYFRPVRTVLEQRRPRRANAAPRVFDQGVGRALWFVECADPDAIGDVVARFAPDRRADLWAGVGLAATFAGGVDARALRRLRRRAAGAEPHLAQGSAFASKARERAGALSPECEIASQILAECASTDAARITDLAAAGIADPAADASYERWRATTRRLLGERRRVA